MQRLHFKLEMRAAGRMPQVLKRKGHTKAKRQSCKEIFFFAEEPSVLKVASQVYSRAGHSDAVQDPNLQIKNAK
jgi:hypothetical protein